MLVVNIPITLMAMIYHNICRKCLYEEHYILVSVWTRYNNSAESSPAIYIGNHVSQTGKYDLNNLNTDFFTTTSNPWDNLMSQNEPFPDSFVENIMSNYNIKNEKQSVNVQKVETEETMVGDKYTKDRKEKENYSAKYKPAINSYVG